MSAKHSIAKLSIAFLILASLVAPNKIGQAEQAQTPRPDLVVLSIQTTGNAVLRQDGWAEVPILVVVKNKGNAAAGIFMVELDATIKNRPPAYMAFLVPGQTDGFPKSKKMLQPGVKLGFAGKALFFPSIHNQTVGLSILVDSCGAEEFWPDYCGVKESNENNNRSSLLAVFVP